MKDFNASAIDFVEAAYDLEFNDAEWFARVLDVGRGFLDHGLGLVGAIFTRPSGGGPILVDRVHVASGPGDLLERCARTRAELPPHVMRALTRPGLVATLSELQGQHPCALESFLRHNEYAQDALGISSVDPDGQGIIVCTPLPKATTLAGEAHERAQMVSAHLCAAHRLRRGMSELNRTLDIAAPEFPLGTEAILDPSGFHIVHAAREVRSRNASQAIRQAALRVDRARGSLRESDPDEALRLWDALIRGRWSLVDWFDVDDRRYVLALPNPPRVLDPRGLTEPECQVITYASLGETGKMIGYRLGMPSARASALIKSAMRKLGVRTRAQLVARMLPLEVQLRSSKSEPFFAKAQG